jgi:guanylate kinase
MSIAPTRLFVIAAPSGAGKTTLVKALTTRNPELRFSISYTTRPKRRNEAHGVDYLFVDKEAFDRLRARGALLESAEVFDNFYGTSREQVEQHLGDGHHVILEIDWQGAQQVRNAMPECVTVFILPPSREELERRLRSRGTDTEAVIQRRLRDALSDMSHWYLTTTSTRPWPISKPCWPGAVPRAPRPIRRSEKPLTNSWPENAGRSESFSRLTTRLRFRG